MKQLRVLALVFLGACVAMGAHAQKSADLIISGGTIVAMDGPRSVYQEGAVAVVGDSIAAIGPRA